MPVKRVCAYFSVDGRPTMCGEFLLAPGLILHFPNHVLDKMVEVGFLKRLDFECDLPPGMFAVGDTYEVFAAKIAKGPVRIVNDRIEVSDFVPEVKQRMQQVAETGKMQVETPSVASSDIANELLSVIGGGSVEAGSAVETSSTGSEVSGPSTISESVSSGAEVSVPSESVSEGEKFVRGEGGEDSAGTSVARDALSREVEYALLMRDNDDLYRLASDFGWVPEGRRSRNKAMDFLRTVNVEDLARKLGVEIRGSVGGK